MKSKISEYQLLSELLKICLKQNIPFVSFQLPYKNEVITLVQHHSMPEKLENLNDLSDRIGFVIAPFTSNDTNSTYFLKPDCVFFSDNIDEIYIQKLANNDRFIGLEERQKQLKTTTSDEFIHNVEQAVEEENKGKFQKVVLSKIRKESFPDQFQPETFFLKLCRKYPHAFVYILQLPEVGRWVGATPEPLLTIENGICKTVSLAGTQLATDMDISTYKWNNKELEEQEIVTNFVEKTLCSIHIENFKKTGPENFRAANLIHLKTTFEFSQKELSNNFSELLKALHPTPSVGGLPKDEARKFILANEQHNRSYYTGFLGPVNINEQSAVFVNLRCSQLFDNEIILFSGAGITSTSNAQKEWEETDNKMLTLLNVMKDS